MVQKIEISPKIVVFTVLFLLALVFIWNIRQLIYVIFFAFVFMGALKPIVNFLERYKISRPVAVAIVSLCLSVTFFLISSFVFPIFVKQTIAFVRILPDAVGAIPGFTSYINIDLVPRFLPNVTENILNIISGLFSNFIVIVSIIIFTFYFLFEEKFLKKFLDKFLRERDSDKIFEVFTRAEKAMGDWVRGQLILMLVIGLATYLGLVLLGIKYAFPLAVIAGLLEVVPYIGPILSSLPSIFLGISYSWIMGIYIAILYLIIQQLENNFIVPVVMKKATGLNPIVTLIVLVIGGELGGVFGIIISIPLTLFMETVLSSFLKEI